VLSIAAAALVVLPVLPVAGPTKAAPAHGSDPVPIQAQQAQPAAATDPHPIWVQPMTVLDHLDTLAGHLVELSPCRVTRIVSATLVELRDARERGRYRFRQWDDRDTLLALLPPGAKVLKDDVIVVTGSVSTVAAANAERGLTGVTDEILEDRRNDALLVATRVAPLGASNR